LKGIFNPWETRVDIIVAYSKERIQYERPVGAFQALQHKMADMWTAMEISRYLVYEAAWMESEGCPCAKEASIARYMSTKSTRILASG
jgi:alkylation response protein AidB-like acyl-CoA dehydrogenase